MKLPAVLCIAACLAACAATGPVAAAGVRDRFLRDPAAVQEIVFAVRAPGHDPHWYANFSSWSSDPQRKLYGGQGGKLCRLELASGRLAALVDDPKGDVRDPAVDYDGRTILFSYRCGGSEQYHLYLIQSDGTGLRQITSGPWDDIEPCFLPCGDIVFCSSRCKRFVQCWHTPVAILYRAGREGQDPRPISANVEHDNTPAVLPDGRLLYTRWEYVDRSQVEFHHLWTANPDGSGVMVYYGNMHAGGLLIDARPIPGTDRVVAVHSPGHGRTEHAGSLVVIDPKLGPDERGAERAVGGLPGNCRDPYPLSATYFLAALGRQIVLLDAASGQREVLYESPVLEVHEPRPLRPRPREPVLADRTTAAQATGRMILADVYRGRNMAGVRRGEIRKLLVLESLPKPVNFSGGPEPLTWLGTFTLERVLGTVPVEPDGSASFEVPAGRPVFFVALDENDLSVKRMQSFASVMPGETLSCGGCHEPRTEPPEPPSRAVLMALGRRPSRIEPFADQPDVLDFPRDIQPILDQHCVCCHDYVTHAGAANGPRGGGAVLAGDRGPTYSHSFWTLLARRQVADGRNGWGNRLPRSIGSSASPLLKKIDGSHYGVTLSEHQRRTVWLWIESGAPYAGTYAALGSGMVGVPILAGPQAEQSLVETGLPDGSALLGRARQVIQRRCETCHTAAHLPLAATMRRPTGPSANFERILGENDPLARFSPHALFNLTRPELSLVLLGPLAKAAGGYGSCAAGQARAAPAKDVFAGTDDPDYQTLLAVIRDRRAALERIGRFDVAAFRPNQHYVRQMKQYGILPAAFDRAKDPIDVYQTDRAYWRSLWYAGGKD
ncbi:MAG: hypothetical protein ABSG86_19115 [Thermoguttaceae bacterium]|jgi:hypothetical protein